MNAEAENVAVGMFVGVTVFFVTVCATLDTREDLASV